MGVIIEGTLLINDRWVCILFNSGATHSFIVQDYVVALKLAPKVLRVPLRIYLPVGRDVMFIWVCWCIRINFDDLELFTQLVVLPMDDYGVILSIDWLSTYRVYIDCFAKMVTFLVLR